MNQDTFIEERQKNWTDLGERLKSTESKGLKSLSADNIRELGISYRKICSDLSYARSRKYSARLIEFLNQLTRRVYGLIYLSDNNSRGGIRNFYQREFADLVRKNRGFILLATLMFLAGTATGYIWTLFDTGFCHAVVPGHFIQMWDRDVKETPHSETVSSGAPLTASWYWTHNFKVGLYSFALGITLGLGSVFFLIYNGIIFGSLLSLVIKNGNQGAFLDFITPHTPMEIMALLICGGAGLIIAWALISPGDLPRADSMNIGGRTAVRLVLGTIPMFLLAGIIESTISHMAIPFIYKIAFATLTAVALFLFFTRSGLENKQKKYMISSIRNNTPPKT